jgi:TolB-like protein/Tfp pilus assembly protein PilF
MSFFNELKRRNVFRVGIAYAVGAWVVLQLTDVVGEILELPPFGGKIILLVIIVGFPITLLAAWAFELTPEGIKRENEVDRTQSITPQTGKRLNTAILVLMALAIGYLLLDKFYLSEIINSPDKGIVEQTTPDLPAVVAEPRIGKKSIAVLPFVNRSRLEDDEFFVEGVHDDLLTKLARIGNLKVISRTSVLRYKDTDTPIPDIARELGVATVMEGAVQRSGNTVRINVQLIDAQTDEHLWAEIFDRELTADNLFNIQTEISERIATALKATLSSEEQERISDKPTESLAAYNAFLRARQLQSLRTSESLQQAMTEYERAVELDPDYAMAWVGVAEAAGLLINYGTLVPVEANKRIEEAANRALALNDQLGEAYLSLADVHQYYERDAEAEQAYKKAIELSPGYATAYQWYANFIANFPGRIREALAVSAKARELDPMSSIIRFNHINKLQALGRYGEAETELVSLLELDPGFPAAYSGMADIMAETGRFDEEVLWRHKGIERDPGRIASYLSLGFALLNLGDVNALTQVRESMDEIDSDHWSIGWLDMLNTTYEQNYPATLESAKWVNQQLGSVPSFQGFLGYINIMDGDYIKARKEFEIAEPRYWNRASWRAAIEKDSGLGCTIATTMLHTGDEEMAIDLLRVIITYLETELPSYIDHADRYNYVGCYAAAGDYEKALDAFEVSVDHGHYQFWWAWTKFPTLEPLRGNPRWEAGLAKIHERNASQRENLARIREEGRL